MRLNRAWLAALLCSATAPAGMCDPTEQMSPFTGAQWSIVDSGSTTSRAMVAPNSLTQEVVQLPDATVVLLARPAVDTRSDETMAPAHGLPSTSTASEVELQSGLR